MRHAIKTTRSPLGSDSIIPKAATKASIKVADIPGGIVPVSASQHRQQYGSADTRSFSIGIDHQGKPFLISEAEVFDSHGDIGINRVW